MRGGGGGEGRRGGHGATAAETSRAERAVWERADKGVKAKRACRY